MIRDETDDARCHFCFFERVALFICHRIDMLLMLISDRADRQMLDKRCENSKTFKIEGNWKNGFMEFVPSIDKIEGKDK